MIFIPTAPQVLPYPWSFFNLYVNTLVGQRQKFILCLALFTEFFSSENGISLFTSLFYAFP